MALTTLKSPSPLKFTPDEWHLNNHSRYQPSETEQQLANTLLTESKHLCKLTMDKVKKNKNEIDCRLNEKLSDIDYCKSELLRIRKNVVLEISALSTYKERIARALSSIKEIALVTCEECLLAREHRRGLDLVHDNVDKELLKECEAIKGTQRLLNQVLEQIYEQIRRLKAALYYVDRDLKDDERNVDVDHRNLNLKQISSDLSLCSDGLPLDTSSSTMPNQRKVQTSENILAASREVQNARPLRCYIDTIIIRTMDDLKSRKKATDDALQRHIRNTKETKVELELQHSKIMHQVSEIISNAAHIETAIEEQERYMSTLAQMRLSTRRQCLDPEVAEDPTEKFFTKEIRSVHRTTSQLQKTLFESQASLRYLLRMQAQIEEDINVKTNTLKIDEVQCATLRHNINYCTF